jgi:phosphonate transport system substrate-binding protein
MNGTDQISAKSFLLNAIWVERFAWRWLAALLLLTATAHSAESPETNDATNLGLVRFGFSAEMFTDVNENDAKASVNAWARAFSRERNVPMSADPIVLSDIGELEKSLRSAALDGAAVPTKEFLDLAPELRGTNLFMSSTGGRFTEEYLLLVRADSGIASLGALHGRKMVLFDNIRASLAPLWLDEILLEAGRGTATNFFGQISLEPKLVKVVLPVFFRQQDACVVTRRGFEIMSEMNPQVQAQLRVLATSPGLVPSVGFLRIGFDSPLRDRMMYALRGLNTSASGAQVLTLFQIDQLQEAPASLLNSARDLLSTRERLMLASGNRTNTLTRNAAAPGQP